MRPYILLTNCLLTQNTPILWVFIMNLVLTNPQPIDMQLIVMIIKGSGHE